MAKQHKIQWLNLPGYKGETWNPIIGCSKVSAGCENCYAERMANRLSFNPNTPWYKYVVTDGKWNGKTALLGGHPILPFTWKAPRLIFVCSMGDLFHEKTKFQTIDKIFATMASCPQHIFIVLTKRAKRMSKYFKWYDTSWNSVGMQGNDRIRYYCYHDFGVEIDYNDWKWPLPNVWLGVTAENQEQANKRIPYLLEIPAAVRFVSFEPMLRSVSIAEYWRECGAGAYEIWLNGLDWVIAGGESGPGARPLHPDWVRTIRDQCKASEVPFFFKQWGEYRPANSMDKGGKDKWKWISTSGTVEPSLARTFHNEREHHELMFLCGKSKAGNLLDGGKYEQYPIIDNK